MGQMGVADEMRMTFKPADERVKRLKRYGAGVIQTAKSRPQPIGRLIVQAGKHAHSRAPSGGSNAFDHLIEEFLDVVKVA